MGYWDNICDTQKKQTEKGVNTYGMTLEENNLVNVIERINYLQEEMIDALMYFEWIKEAIGKAVTNGLEFEEGRKAEKRRIKGIIENGMYLPFPDTPEMVLNQIEKEIKINDVSEKDWQQDLRKHYEEDSPSDFRNYLRSLLGENDVR